MRQKVGLRAEHGSRSVELLVKQIGQVVALLGKAEFDLKNLGRRRLPELVRRLAAAAALVEALHGVLRAASQDTLVTPELRLRMKQLEYATARVSALHEAAMRFHSGLMRLRQSEMAEYDAVGVVCTTAELYTPAHCLEARG